MCIRIIISRKISPPKMHLQMPDTMSDTWDALHFLTVFICRNSHFNTALQPYLRKYQEVWDQIVFRILPA